MSPDIDQEAVQKGFVMKGDIKVVDQPNILNSNANNAVIGLGLVLLLHQMKKHRLTTNTPSTQLHPIPI